MVAIAAAPGGALPMMPPPALLTEMALESGFDLVGFGPADPGAHGPHLEAWLAAGRHADMAWLERNLPRLLDPTRLLPGARSAVALGFDYSGPPGELPGGGRIARYAIGRDYHRALGSRLARLSERLRREGVPADSLRAGVDATPILERAIAARAGVGFLAKSSGIIHPARGPWLLLAEILTTAEIPTSAPARGSCGTCTACLDACPTGALVAPHQLDARQCISYTTIERRGPIPWDLRAPQGDWVFGCDICIEVCPFTSRARDRRDDPDLTPHRAVAAYDLVGLLTLTPEDYEAHWTGTAMRRAHRSGLRRNAAIVLGNRRHLAAIPALVDALTDEDAGVRTSAAWALARMGTERAAIARALARESAADIRTDLERSLASM